MELSTRGVLGTALAAGLALGAASGARAGLGGSVAVTSDNVLRGLSQSDNRPAAQGELHWNFPAGWSGGVSASELRFAPNRASLELGAQLQWHGALSDDFDLGAALAHYSYPDDPRPVGYEYEELGVSLAWRDQLYAAASWIPNVNFRSTLDGSVRDRQALSLEASWHRTLRPRLDLSAGLGFFDPQGLEYASYAYGNATLGWHYGHWRAHLNWIWVQDASNRRYSAGPAGGPWTLTVAWGF
jgi:uncharacterized protein (TIGR02001 family)